MGCPSGSHHWANRSSDGGYELEDGSLTSTIGASLVMDGASLVADSGTASGKYCDDFSRSHNGYGMAVFVFVLVCVCVCAPFSYSPSP